MYFMYIIHMCVPTHILLYFISNHVKIGHLNLFQRLCICTYFAVGKHNISFGDIKTEQRDPPDIRGATKRVVACTFSRVEVVLRTQVLNGTKRS